MKRKVYRKPQMCVVEAACESVLLVDSSHLGTEVDRGENYCLPVNDRDFWEDDNDLQGHQRTGVRL